MSKMMDRFMSRPDHISSYGKMIGMIAQMEPYPEDLATEYNRQRELIRVEVLKMVSSPQICQSGYDHGIPEVREILTDCIDLDHPDLEKMGSRKLMKLIRETKDLELLIWIRDKMKYEFHIPED